MPSSLPLYVEEGGIRVRVLGGVTPEWAPQLRRRFDNGNSRYFQSPDLTLRAAEGLLALCQTDGLEVARNVGVSAMWLDRRSGKRPLIHRLATQSGHTTVVTTTQTASQGVMNYRTDRLYPSGDVTRTTVEVAAESLTALALAAQRQIDAAEAERMAAYAALAPEAVRAEPQRGVLGSLLDRLRGGVRD